jgi:hypothetical protein
VTLDAEGAGGDRHAGGGGDPPDGDFGVDILPVEENGGTSNKVVRTIKEDLSVGAGRSLVIARTTAGAALLAAAEVAGRTFIQPLETAAIAAMQPAQARRKKQILSRLAALMVTGRPWPRYRGLRLWAAAARDNPVAQARSFAGLVRRLVQGRA